MCYWSLLSCYYFGKKEKVFTMNRTTIFSIPLDIMVLAYAILIFVGETSETLKIIAYICVGLAILLSFFASILLGLFLHNAIKTTRQKVQSLSIKEKNEYKLIPFVIKFIVNLGFVYIFYVEKHPTLSYGIFLLIILNIINFYLSFKLKQKIFFNFQK